MKCSSCSQDITDASFFCSWCNRFVPAPEKGEKAGLFHRFIAWMLDFFVPLLGWVGSTLVVAAVSEELALAIAILFPLGWLVWALTLFPKGQTPGKYMLGLRVVRQRTGANPGFGIMLIREIPGRILSGLFLMLGYLWALFDTDGQNWHDKLGGTVVLRQGRP